MLNYFVLVNKENKIIIIDFETDEKNCKPDVGYETDCSDWSTQKLEYMQDDNVFFDEKKVFREMGIYKVIGYDNSFSTPEGYSEDYMVEKIVKISDLPYLFAF